MGERARFPLEALEGLRRRAVDEARSALALALEELAGESARAREAEEARAAAEASWRRAVGEPAGADPSALAQAARWRASAWRRLGDLQGRSELRREEVRRSEAVAACRRAALGAAEQALRAVERHREAWEAERRRTAERSVEAEQDDRVTARVGGSA